MEDEKKTKYRRFHSPDHVRRFISDLINRLDHDEITGNKARQLGYLSKLLLEAMGASEYDARFKALEKAAGINTWLD